MCLTTIISQVSVPHPIFLLLQSSLSSSASCALPSAISPSICDDFLHDSCQSGSPLVSSLFPHSINMCVASLSHSVSASTLPWWMHLVNSNLLSTCFGGRLSCQDPHLSKNGCCNPSVRVLLSENVASMLPPRHVKRRLDVDAGDVHRVSVAALPDFFPSVFLPLLTLLQQLRTHHLEMLTTDTVNSSHV